MEDWEEILRDLRLKLLYDLEKQKEELLDFSECDGNSCECEVSYNVAATYRCKHCYTITVDIEDEIKKLTSQLLSSQKQDLKKKIEEWIDSEYRDWNLQKYAGHENLEIIGYNQALSDLKEFIKTL